MTPTDPDSLPDFLDSCQKLLSALYQQKACKNCGGTGIVWVNRGNGLSCTCCDCSGRGWVWEAPIGG